MLDAEKQMLQSFGHDIAEKHLPAVIEAEIKRLPEAMQGFAMMLYAQAKPMMIAMLDAEVDKLIAAKGQ